MPTLERDTLLSLERDRLLSLERDRLLSLERDRLLSLERETCGDKARGGKGENDVSHCVPCPCLCRPLCKGKESKRKEFSGGKSTPRRCGRYLPCLCPSFCICKGKEEDVGDEDEDEDKERGLFKRFNKHQVRPVYWKRRESKALLRVHLAPVVG
jgi:hypothetical protein